MNLEVQSHNNDEINLLELLQTLKKRWKTIVSMTAIAVVGSFCYLSILTPIYTQTLTLSVPNVNNVNNINNVVQAILEQKAKESKEENELSFELSSKQKQGMLDIELQATSPQNLLLQRQLFLNFINTHPAITPLLNQSRQGYQKLMTQIDAQIAKNKALKDHIDTQILSGKNPALGFNPLEMEKAILELLEKRNQYETALLQTGKFEVLTTSPLPKHPSKPKKGLIITVSTTTGLILGIFVALLQEFLSNRRQSNY